MTIIERNLALRRTNLPSVVMIACLAFLVSGCGNQPTGPSVVDADAPTDFTETDSGLKYRILRRGSGRKPLASDRVKVDYSGRLENGQLFDTTYNGADPAAFALSEVIVGWREGMQLVGEGGMIELLVPPELGYGATGKPPAIPPNSTLLFKVELLEIQ